MKRFLQRVTAVLLCVVMCLSVVPTMTFVSAATDMPLLAFVPLDNRPVCTDRVIYAAGAAGFDIRLPDEDLYRTYLDNQGKNANGTQHGDGTAIAAWLMEMEAAGCNHYIIHLDQMFSGGLVGSRYPDSATVTAAETDIIDNCLIPLTNNYENKVYFVDTVMRLASTGSYKGYEIGEYSSFREYAAKPRWVLNADNFATDNFDTSLVLIDGIFDFYQLDTNWETITYYTGEKTEWKSPLTQAQIDQYHAFRRRKLELINLMMQFANRKAVYIIGVDDASPGNTIQSNEINFIRQRMTACGIDYTLSADTDSSGLMALARCVNDYYGANPTVRVRYYGNKADEAADDYDIGTLRENVSEHIRSLNGVEVSGTADIEVLVLTQADTSIQDTKTEDATYTANIHALVAQANANIAANKPTIVIEASTEKNYLYSWVKGLPNLQDELLENVEISRLLGYSNWNTVGNSIGIAMGTGVSRYTYLKYADEVTPASDIAFVQSMTYSYIKDITYNARNKHQHFTETFQYWITNKAGGSGWNNGNFYQQMINYQYDYKEDWELCGGEHYVNNNLEWFMMKGDDPNAYSGCGQQILNAVMAGEMYTRLGDAVHTANVGMVTLDKFHCPWYRQFEITFEITAAVEYFTTDSGYINRVTLAQSADDFAAKAVQQYGASAVTVTDQNGSAITSAYIGTGFTVSITVDGTVTTYTAVVRGDVSADGLSDTSDVRLTLRNIVDVLTFSEAQTTAADHDGNGKVTSTDARRMLQDLMV